MSNLKKQIPRFIVAGCSAVGTDALVYAVLLNFISHSLAKAISFLSGTIVAFIINKYWTFEKPVRSHSEVYKFILLYSTTLLVNVGVNQLLLIILPELVVFAFLAATGTSMVLNFIGQKWWVFK